MPSEKGLDVLFERTSPYSAKYLIKNLRTYNDTFDTGVDIKRITDHPAIDSVATQIVGLAEGFTLTFPLIEGEEVEMGHNSEVENTKSVLAKRVFLRTHYRPFQITSQYKLTEKYPAELNIPDYVIPVMIVKGSVVFNETNNVNPVATIDVKVGNSVGAPDIGNN